MWAVDVPARVREVVLYMHVCAQDLCGGAMVQTYECTCNAANPARVNATSFKLVVA